MILPDLVIKPPRVLNKLNAALVRGLLPLDPFLVLQILRGEGDFNRPFFFFDLRPVAIPRPRA